MSLLALGELRDSFVCPRCRAALTSGTAEYRCPTPDCVGTFPTVDDWPVLVDFASSVLEEAEVLSGSGGSPIRRGRKGGAKKKLVDWLFPSGEICWTNVDHFRDSLPNGRPRPRILVIGGGTVGGGGVGDLYRDPNLDVVSFDIYGSASTQFIADAHRIPLAAGSVDGVVAQAVLEHVLEPWVVAEEIHRVLRPGGVVYAETPFLQQVHEGAYDFTRFTESGHRWLFKKFELIDSGALSGLGAYLQWTVDHTARSLLGTRRAGTIAKAMLFWVHYADRLVRPGFDVDTASAVYFLGRRAERELSPKEIVGHYKGAQTRGGR